MFDHWGCGRRGDDAADPGAGGANALRKTAFLLEPLGDHWDGGDEEEASSESDHDALGQAELPELLREGGCDETASHEGDADEHRGVGAIIANNDVDERGDAEGCGEVRSAHEGIVEIGRARKDVVG